MLTAEVEQFAEIIVRENGKSWSDAIGEANYAKEFFRWVYANGDTQAKALDYVPLPDALVQQIEKYWSANMSY